MQMKRLQKLLQPCSHLVEPEGAVPSVFGGSLTWCLSSCALRSRQRCRDATFQWGRAEVAEAIVGRRGAGRLPSCVVEAGADAVATTDCVSTEETLPVDLGGACAGVSTYPPPASPLLNCQRLVL